MLLSCSLQLASLVSDSNENKNEKYTQRKREKKRNKRGKENFDDGMKVNIHTVCWNYVWSQQQNTFFRQTHSTFECFFVLGNAKLQQKRGRDNFYARCHELSYSINWCDTLAKNINYCCKAVWGEVRAKSKKETLRNSWRGGKSSCLEREVSKLRTLHKLITIQSYVNDWICSEWNNCRWSGWRGEWEGAEQRASFIA